MVAFTGGDDQGSRVPVEPIGALLGDDGVEQFWLRHLRAGLFLYTGATFLAVCYLYLTPDGPHRGLEWLMAGFSLVATSVVVALPGRAISRSPRRMLFFVTWSVFSSVFALSVAGFDGGLHSPLALFVFIPISYASLAYPARAVTGIGATAAATAVVVALLAGDTFAFTQVFVGTIGMVTLLAASVTSARGAEQAARQHLTERLVEMATRDGLTGCLNHRSFYGAVEGELARAARHQRQVSLLMIDVDAFKSINDTLGHVVGDDVLHRIGTALLGAARTTDVVGRVGGDEFAVLLPETDRSAAEVAAARFRGEVAALDGPVPVSVTIGIAHLDAPPTGTSPQRLVAAADAELYEQKNQAARERGDQADR